MAKYRSKTDRMLGKLKEKSNKVTPITKNMILPNQSGDHSYGKVRLTPTADTQIPNKKYVDDNINKITVADESSDTTCFPVFVTSATGTGLSAKSGTNLTFNSSTGVLGATNFTLDGDNSSTDTTYVPLVLYNTDATPPTASTVPIGTIYIQYTA